MKKIAILGSTGSIGTQTLEVVRENQDIEVCALAAGSNDIVIHMAKAHFLFRGKQADGNQVHHPVGKFGTESGKQHGLTLPVLSLGIPGAQSLRGE